MELIGRRVEIQFRGDRGDPWFKGTIKKYDEKSECHHVTFDDGDKRKVHVEEHVELGILRWVDAGVGAPPPTVLAPNPAVDAAVTEHEGPISRNKPPRNKRPIARFNAGAVTSSKRGKPAQAGRSPMRALAGAGPIDVDAEAEEEEGDAEMDGPGDDEPVVGAEEEEDDDDDAEARDSEDDGYHKEEEGRSKPARSKRSPKAAAAPAPTDAAASPSPKKVKGRRLTGAARRFSPRSVAQLGLPAGALAVGRSGFEVRMLDRILPLLSAESLQRALSALGDGREKEASSLVHLAPADAPCVRAFCRELCAKLGVPPTQTIAGGAALSPSAKQRLDVGLARSSDLLPGRVVVVNAGTGVSVRKSGESGGPLCPPELVDVEFSSVDELHAKLPEPLVTYELEATAEPPFAKWSAMAQRLRATSLLPSDAPPGSDESSHTSVYVCRITCTDEGAMPTALIEPLTHQFFERISSDSEGGGDEGDEVRWALLEGGGGAGGRAADREAEAVLLAAPAWLVASAADDDAGAPSARPEDTASMSSASAISLVLPTSEARGLVTTSGELLLPSLPGETRSIKQPASLLQKAIRRRAGALCSPAPLLEACAELLTPAGGNGTSLRGGTAAMLQAVWGGMLADAQPFDAADDGTSLGIAQLLVLTLIARADPSWQLPSTLRRKAVAAALRTQARGAHQWLGFVRTKRDGRKMFQLEPGGGEGDLGAQVRNALRALHASAGFGFCFGAWGKFDGDVVSGAVWAYLKPEFSTWHATDALASTPVPDEKALLDSWDAGRVLTGVTLDGRTVTLDMQARLAAYDLSVCPSALLLVQALLPCPPDNWKRSSLPSLARHFRKLSAELNPRDQQRQLLARVDMLRAQATDSTGAADAPQGSALDAETRVKLSKEEMQLKRAFESDVELIEGISPKELELLERIKEVQTHLRARAAGAGGHAPYQQPTALLAAPKEAPRVRASAGGALSEHDGRCGFLLAFGHAVNLQGVGAKKEDVAVLFAGTMEEPLLVQRVGKGREAAAAAADGPTTGASGAAAAPQLGYVTKREATHDMDERAIGLLKADAALFDAAVQAAAKWWEGGRHRPLAIPPRGLQWAFGAKPGDEEVMEADVHLAAEYDATSSSWSFSIAGHTVDALDARAVLSPCSAPSEVAALETGSTQRLLLQRALYAFPVKTDATTEHPSAALGMEPWPKADGGDVVARQLNLTTGLELFERLHSMATDSRIEGAREGFVYEWAGLAASGAVTFGTWRDALLSITTRDAAHVVLGPVQADGTGTGRDMTEGPLYRIFHALECLYPATLIKEGALKWRVVPRGAAYNHLLSELERLGRGAIDLDASARRGGVAAAPCSDDDAMTSPAATSKCFEDGASSGPSKPTEKLASRRPKRKAGEVATAAAATAAHAEADGRSAVVVRSPVKVKQMLGMPRITSALWDHQQRSVAATLDGVRAGKLGFADASTVGAGKTLTALATIVELAKHMDAKHMERHGVLIMLPESNLIKEWLLELGKHTSGFHVVEQRCDGQLFSLTYAKSHPPIDANTIVLSTLDRVATHPFVRQVAWDFVVIDECLAVQNAAAKRCPSAWRQIEVSSCGVLMLSATFFRSSYPSLFYMIRMLRSPLPRTMEFLPALIHEHIVCEVPETDRQWTMHGEAVSLAGTSMDKYRKMIDQFERRRLNHGDADGMKLWSDLASFLRGEAWEGRGGGEAGAHYGLSSPLAEAFVKQAQKMVKAGNRPLVFANTEDEKAHLLSVMRAQGLDALAWSDVQSANLRMGGSKGGKAGRVIVANKGTEGHGSNMQRDADAIICRPTAGDALEQMKGRVDRPGQATKQLVLVVIYAANTVEEAEFANIRLAGNFFRQYTPATHTSAPLCDSQRPPCSPAPRLIATPPLPIGTLRPLRDGTRRPSTWRVCSLRLATGSSGRAPCVMRGTSAMSSGRRRATPRLRLPTLVAAAAMRRAAAVTATKETRATRAARRARAAASVPAALRARPRSRASQRIISTTIMKSRLTRRQRRTTCSLSLRRQSVARARARPRWWQRLSRTRTMARRRSRPSTR